MIFLFVLGPQEFGDTVYFLKDAQSYITNLQSFSILYTPVFPIFLSIFYFSDFNYYFICIFINILPAAISSILILKITYMVFNCNLTSKLSAIIYCCWPHFIFFSISILSETLFIFFLLLAIYYLLKNSYYKSYIFFCIAILTKPSLELLVIPLLITFFYKKVSLIDLIKKIFKFLLIYVLIMSPWWLHNYNKYEEFVRLAPADGLALYAGNNIKNISGGGTWFTSSFINEADTDVDLSPFEGINYSKSKSREFNINDNKLAKKLAIQYILKNPVMFLESSYNKFLRFWSPYPNAIAYQQNKLLLTMSTIIYLSLYVLACFGFIYLFQKNKRYFFFLLLPLLYYTSIHMVTVASIRYRLPIELILIMVSSYAFLKIIKLK